MQDNFVYRCNNAALALGILEGMVHVVFRVDSSIKIGIGHLMRCLTLADALSATGASVDFILRKHVGEMSHYVSRRGYNVFLLNSGDLLSQESSTDGAENYVDWLGVAPSIDALDSCKVLPSVVDWLVVDHYALDIEWERLMRPHVGKILAIDDLASRKHDCDLLLDQTFRCSADDYAHLVPSYCKLILGSAYALLRPEFRSLRAAAIAKRLDYKGVRRILISIGGLDETNLTNELLRVLSAISWEVAPVIDIVLTSNAPYLEAVKRACNELPLVSNLHVDVENMAELMLHADLAIGAGGATSWERCCLALPSILVVLAKNQEVIGRRLMLAGAVLLVETGEQFHLQLKMAMEGLVRHQNQYLKMAENAAAICDGTGASLLAGEMSYE